MAEFFTFCPLVSNLQRTIPGLNFPNCPQAGEGMEFGLNIMVRASKSVDKPTGRYYILYLCQITISRFGKLGTERYK